MFSQLIVSGKKALFLREMGYILLLGGTLHFVAVTYLYLTKGFPEHDRIGYVYFIGLMQLAAGLLDIQASKLLQADRSRARTVLGIAVLLMTGYALIILPVYPKFSLLFKLAPPAYLVYHWWALIKLRAGNTPS
jgi:hypothetical protein